MKIKLLFSIAVSVVFVCGCKRIASGDYPYYQGYYEDYNLRQDLVFDQEEVTCIITPETDTLYFGFSRFGLDTLTDRRLAPPENIIIDRNSTAKRDRDYVINDGRWTEKGFKIACNLTSVTGKFSMVVFPEKIAEPLFVNLSFDYSRKGRITSMKVNLIPEQ